MSLRRCLVASIALLVLIGDQRVAACERAAGIVAYSELDGQTLILIADHKLGAKRGWATFGGCVEQDETIEQGALREFREETRCAFDNVTLDAEAPRVNRGRYTSFALEVDYVDASAIAAGSRAQACGGGVFDERGPWAWVERNTLVEALNNGNVDERITLPESIALPNTRRWFWNQSAWVIDAFEQMGVFRPQRSR